MKSAPTITKEFGRSAILRYEERTVPCHHSKAWVRRQDAAFPFKYQLEKGAEIIFFNWLCKPFPQRVQIAKINAGIGSRSRFGFGMERHAHIGGL